MMSLSSPLSVVGIMTTPLELISFVLALITIVLNIRQNHWAWLFAIVSSTLYGIVFFGARLYGDSALQVMFVVISIWGWHQWLRGGQGHHPLRVSSLGMRGIMRGISMWLIGFIILSELLWRFTDTDVPRADGFLTAGSVLGQFLLSKKKLENWLVWIVVDILYIGLYVYKDLHVTAVLYGIFTILAYVGWRTWKSNTAQACA